MCRELREGVYATGRLSAQQKKTGGNQIFSPQGYPQVAPRGAMKRAVRAIFTGISRCGRDAHLANNRY
jgi:hypothetical protein